MNYSFDYGNRLRDVSGLESGYLYDADGRRIQQSSAAGTINSFYDHSGQLVYQQDRDGTTHDYLYLGGHLVAIRDYDTHGIATAMRYQHTDAIGSIIRQTDKTGAEIAGTGYIYDAFGKQVGGSAHDGPGYTGHVMDAATGLTYMQQRYYDPVSMRFLSMDPVEANSAGGNLDRYWYASDNPYRYTDPDGRQFSVPDCGDGGCFPAGTKGGTGTMMGIVADANMAIAEGQGDSHPERGAPGKLLGVQVSQTGRSSNTPEAAGSDKTALGPYSQLIAAAEAALRAVGDRGLRSEYDGVGYGGPGQYYATSPKTSGNIEGFATPISLSSPPAFIYHTHGLGIFMYPDYFSINDVHMAQQLKVPSFIGSYEAHSIRMFDPRTMRPISRRDFGGGYSTIGMAPGVLICSDCFP